MGARGFRVKFGMVALLLQTAFAILFAFFVQYDESADPRLPKMTDQNYDSNGKSHEETAVLLAAKYPGKNITCIKKTSFICIRLIFCKCVCGRESATAS